MQSLILIIVFAFLLSPFAEASPKVNSSMPEAMLIAQATASVPDFSDVVVHEGVGFDEFTFGNNRCTKDFIVSKLGKPDRETTDQWISYIPQYGLHFWMPTPDGPLKEIRLERRFRGRLSSNVTLSTRMTDVFSVYGEPVAEKTIESFQSPSDTDRTLYRVGNRSKIRYRDYGLLFWFDGDAIAQIVLSEVKEPRKQPLRQLPLPARQPSMLAFDTSAIVVKEGVGFDDFIIGNRRCTKQFIKKRLGEPSEETDQWMNYRPRLGIDFWMPGPDKPLGEIRMNRGFKGRLSSNVTLSSSMDDVFSVYGAPTAQETVDSFNGRVNDRTLYKLGNRSKIFYHQYGLLFSFEGKNILQMVAYASNGPVPPPLRTLPFRRQEVYPVPITDLDTSRLLIREGIGFGEFAVSNEICTRDFIKARLGEPEQETEERLNYKPLGIDFWMYGPTGAIQDIRFTRPFRGRLTTNVSLSSSMEDVFWAYGAPVAEETVDSFSGRFNNRTHYRMGKRSKIHYIDYGLDFFFEGDQISMMVVYKPRGPVPPPPRTLPLSAKTLAGDFPQKHPRWGPVGYIDRLWSYVKDSWMLFFLIAAALAIALYPVPEQIRKLYYRWRPLPEGRLLILRDPSKQMEGNINIWYEARRLKKRKLLIGSDEAADIRLVHESIMPAHAFVGARRFEGGVLTYIGPLGDAKVAVNEEQKSIMPMPKNARIKIGKFIFQYEQPSEYRQVQVRYKNGKVLEGVPTSWDIGSNGFIMLPCRARSWIDAKFISFNKVKGIYFMRDWDEDVRKKLMKGGKDLFKHPATIHFIDGETAAGYLIGDYSISSQRFYFFPHDQEGNVVYILVERSSTQSILEGEIHERAAVPTD